MTPRLIPLFLALALTAPADTLTLRNGAALTGNWFGIDRGIVKFQTNGEVQEFRTSDVVSVAFAADTVSSFIPPAAPTPASLAAPAGNLEQQLKSQYQLTTFTADYSNVVTMGSSLILQKRGFALGALSNHLPTKYTYKDGQIRPDAIGATKKIYDRAASIRGAIPGLSGHGPDTSKAADAAGTWKPLVNGERLYVTQITVQKSDDSIIFDLITDAYPNEGRYKGSLAFQYPGATLSSANLAGVQPTIAEVLAIEFSPDQTPAPQTLQIRADAPLPPDTPPPPPPPSAIPLAPIAPPPPVTQPASTPSEINFQPGATIAEVTARLGPPIDVATFGAKKIYRYKDLKITFQDGRMTDIQ